MIDFFFLINSLRTIVNALLNKDGAGQRCIRNRQSLDSVASIKAKIAINIRCKL